MKERPILFSEPMVRAILDGRKTMTRRVVKPQPKFEFNDVRLAYGGVRNIPDCPYFKEPGDRLWVREAWRPLWDDADKPGGLGDCVQYRADMSKRKPLLKDIGFDDGMKFDEMCDESCHEPRWRPSIHMPRWASRIALEIVSVKVERVQDISEEAAISEGVIPNKTPITESDGSQHMAYGYEYRYAFEKLWDTINAKRGFGWDINPWVWAISFKVVK